MREGRKNAENAEQTAESTADASKRKAAEKSEGAQEVSSKAAGMSEDTYTTTRSGNSLPIREHKVEQARRKIKAGAYDLPEVRDAIVEKLVDALTG